MRLRNYLRTAYRTAIQFAYARSRYRFFMTTTFVNLDARIRRLALATDALSGIVKPVLIAPPFGRSMLVIAPHHDDEMIGCGGALLRHVEAGGAAHVVFVQDGGSEHEEDGLPRHELVAIREDEARRVAEGAGIAAPTFLRQESLRRDSLLPVTEALARLLDQTEADAVFVPFFLDLHPDHRLTSLALAEALATASRQIRVFSYEVWGLCVPNVAVVIDDVVKRRNGLLALHASQVSGTDYVNSTTGLNMYRARPFGAGTCKYVEAFLEMPSGDYVGLVRRVLGED
jgi:LmbE family N-acetylglucosaminyl deacetylase